MGRGRSGLGSSLETLPGDCARRRARSAPPAAPSSPPSAGAAPRQGRSRAGPAPRPADGRGGASGGGGASGAGPEPAPPTCGQPPPPSAPRCPPALRCCPGGGRPVLSRGMWPHLLGVPTPSPAFSSGGTACPPCRAGLMILIHSVILSTNICPAPTMCRAPF